MAAFLSFGFGFLKALSVGPKRVTNGLYDQLKTNVLELAAK